MPKLFPVSRKIVTSGGAGAPTVEWDDTLAATDNPAPRLTLPDTVAVADKFPDVLVAPSETFGALDVLRVDDTMTYVDTLRAVEDPSPRLTLSEPIALADEFPDLFVTPKDTAGLADTFPTINITPADTAGAKDVVRLIFEVTYDEAGQVTGGDAYTIEGAGNPGAGTTTLLVTNNGAATTGRDAYIKFNLRNDAGGPLANLEAQATPNDTITIALTIAQDDALVAKTLTVAALIQDADPWDEAAITFANAPAHGVAQGTISVAIGAAARYTLTLVSVMGTVLGNWLSLRFRDEMALAITTFTISSLENATTADRPVLSYKLKRGA